VFAEDKQNIVALTGKSHKKEDTMGYLPKTIPPSIRREFLERCGRSPPLTYKKNEGKPFSVPEQI